MKRLLGIALLLALAMLGVGCSGTSTSSSNASSQPASVFVTGEDAPLASVVGFDVTINSITLNGNSNSPQVLSTATTVDFARLLGLRSPLAFNSVPADTYNSATISLSNPMISYVNMTPTPGPKHHHRPVQPHHQLGHANHSHRELSHTNGSKQQRLGGNSNGLRHPAISCS